MASLFETYRPKAFDEVIGQESAIATLKFHLEKRGGYGGKAFFLTGPSGVGKTTLARIAARQIAAPCDIQEIDGGDLTPSAIRSLREGLQFYGWGHGRAIIVNEIHLAKRDTIGALQTVLEDIPEHCAWFFTTTWDGASKMSDGSIEYAPFLSRCVKVKLTNQGMCERFAERLLAIAQAEGLDGRPLADYIRVVKDHKNNMRDCLQYVDSGNMLA